MQRPPLLLFLAAALLISASNALTLCVHSDEVGLQASWQDCCVSSSCCGAEEELPQALPSSCCASKGHESEEPAQDLRQDGCQNVTLATSLDWAPSDSETDLALDLSPLSAPARYEVQLPAPSFVDRTRCRAPPPDPLASLRTVVLLL